MIQLSICSNMEHERDLSDSFCITCHIEIVFISLQSNYTEYYLKESDQLVQLNLNQEALDCLELGIQKNLSLEDTCNEIGDALRRLNKETEATDFYRTGNQIKKLNLNFFKMKSQILEKQKRFEEALICREQIKDIDYYEYLGEKGVLLDQLNKKDEALQFQDQFLVKKDEDQELVFNNKAKILCFQKRFNEALKCYDSALKINPQFTEALFGKGNTLYELHKFEEALNNFDAALKINPQCAEALFGKGNTLSDLHKFEEAIKCYDAALNINPQLTEALNRKGIALQELYNFQEALKCFDAALKINPYHHQKILKNKRNLLCQMAKSNESSQGFDHSLKINPQSIKFEEERNIYQNAINQNKVIEHLADNKTNQIKNQEQYSQHQHSLINKGLNFLFLGKLLLLNNKFQEALIIFDKILAENQIPEAVFYKAQTLFHLKRYEEALIYCDISESLGLNPNETAKLLENILTEMTHFK